MPNNKNKITTCPVCGKPRGKGLKTEFSHGHCVEKMAQSAKEKKNEKVINGRKILFSDESITRGRSNAAAKEYREGKLPDFMFR